MPRVCRSHGRRRGRVHRRAENPRASVHRCRAEWPPVSGANDPYDPKQVAALSAEALDAAVRAATEAFAAAADLEALAAVRPAHLRSEEHTSELQSRQYLVCRLLLEKKKNQ